MYYHNYQLGELIASQLESALREQALGSASPNGYVRRAELGEYLRDRVFARGASLHWQALLREATGSELKVDAFVNDFVADSSGRR